jgi:formate hydrogenlyase subunit 3/multisubunit Na+/H+ antiporter MnhD subunit
MNFLVNFLAYTVGVPILAGIICFFIPQRLRILTRLLAFAVTLASLTASIQIFIRKPLYWPPVPVPIFIVDNLSAFAGIGISFFAFLVTLYTFGFIEKNNGRYFGYVLMTLGSSLGAVFANNLIILMLFWGFLAPLLYLLVSFEGTAKAAASAKKALIIIGGTDALMIFAIALMWKLSGTFAMEGIHIALNGVFPYVAYLFMLTASLAKAGAVPFHSWLPDVAQDGPTPVTAYLPASLDKFLGIYLLARISLNLFIMNGVSRFVLLLVGSVTIIFAVMIALVQHDFKRLLGYHAVSQVGYMVLGIGTGNPIGIAGGLFHMLNNTVYKSCLFLSGGAVEKRTGTTDLAKLGGLAKYMPITFMCCLIASLAISGVPPFNGFVSKWMIYQGIIELGRTRIDRLWILWLTSAMFGSALTLASFMKLLHTTFLGRSSKYSGYVKEVGLTLLFPMAVLAFSCVIFGIFAFAIPLSIFIIPSIGQEIVYHGVWSSMIAAVLILVGVILGLVIYLFSRPKRFRVVSPFVGGEEIGQLERFSGVEFYDTIKEIKALNPVYRKEEAGSLDIYEQGKRPIAFFTKFLQYIHNGVLPTYMVWCLLGMIAMFLILFFMV